MKSVLWKFCYDGDEEKLREALEMGEDVNDITDNNRTLLMYAAASCKNNGAILKILLEQTSIDVNFADDENLTALHVAVQTGKVGAVELLMKDQRVDVNCKDFRQMTPLIIAATKPKSIDIFKLVLKDPRVDVNWVAPNAETMDLTALICAVWYCNIEAVTLLLDDPRLDPNIIVGVGVNALHVAVAQKSNERILKLLLAHPRVDVNSMNGVGTTVLHMAAAKNNLEVVKMILAEPKFTTANAMGEQDRSVCQFHNRFRCP